MDKSNGIVKVETNQTININGIVNVETDGDYNQVAFVSASINIDGKITSNRNIQNMEMFRLYKNEIEESFSEFDSYVYKISEETEKKWEEVKNKSEEQNAESTQ